MPRVLADYLGLVFFFWSNEASGQTREPIHVHIGRGHPAPDATKVWVRPDGSLEVAHNNSRLSDRELAAALEYIALNRAEIIEGWYRHFGM